MGPRRSLDAGSLFVPRQHRRMALLAAIGGIPHSEVALTAYLLHNNHLRRALQGD